MQLNLYTFLFLSYIFGFLLRFIQWFYSKLSTIEIAIVKVRTRQFDMVLLHFREPDSR